MSTKYSVLTQQRVPSAGQSPEQTAVSTVALQMPEHQKPSAEPKAGVINHAPFLVQSKEHTKPLLATISYITDMETNSLVRIFDNEIAPRDEPFCVERDVLQGRTPEQLRDYFALSFVPRFFCSAHIPAGNKITLCSLRNVVGQAVKIYFPQTRLELSNERPLS